MKKKNENNIRDLWDDIKCANLYIIGSQEKKEKRGLKMYLKILWLKNPKPKEGNRYPDTGNTECPKQDKPKQTYMKIYYLKNGKS